MTRSGEEWLFSRGRRPVLAEHRLDGADDGPFHSERALFSDVTIDRDAFTSAAIAWGLDGDSYAVWNAQWTGSHSQPLTRPSTRTRQGCTSAMPAIRAG